MEMEHLSRLFGIGGSRRGPEREPVSWSVESSLQPEIQRIGSLEKFIDTIDFEGLNQASMSNLGALPADPIVREYFSQRASEHLRTIRREQYPDRAQMAWSDDRVYRIEQAIRFAKAASSSHPYAVKSWITEETFSEESYLQEVLARKQAALSEKLPDDETYYGLSYFIDVGRDLQLRVRDSGVEFAQELENWMQEPIQEAISRRENTSREKIGGELSKGRERIVNLRHIRDTITPSQLQT